MRNSELAQALARASTSNLCSAHAAVKVMHGCIKPLFPGARVAGPARTIALSVGQNGAIHRALHTVQPGDVLVASADMDRRFGRFGDLLAASALARGVNGVVIDGAVRDVAELRAMKFPVFSLGFSPVACMKDMRDAIDCEIICGGVRVRPGDFICGDDDGVVVAPYEGLEELARAALDVIEREESIRARIGRGESTCEILGIAP